MKIEINERNLNGENQRDRARFMAGWHEKLMSDERNHLGADMKGWVRLPSAMDEDLVKDIIRTAEEIRDRCTLFIVIGIGGSFLGAKAVIEALNGCRDDWPEVVFAGYNMNGAKIHKLKKRIARESVCICVISKSGKTVEPLLTYSLMKEWMFGKYGREEAARRIFVITDKEKGELRKDISQYGLKSFVIPDDVGGRYSVLTPVGLLPVAVAGHDIRGLLRGAELLEKADWSENSELIQYAVNRTLLQDEGKIVEIFEYFEGNLDIFGEWLKQLFGESEGKEGKGAYPSCLYFSRDLHSIGQFIQQGRQIFSETIIRIKKAPGDIVIPESAGSPYAGKTMEQINNCAELGVIEAHSKAGIPITSIYVEELNEEAVGKLIYFFEMSAALSAYALGLNPFDQLGVEDYKREMRRLVEGL